MAIEPSKGSYSSKVRSAKEKAGCWQPGALWEENLQKRCISCIDFLLSLIIFGCEFEFYIWKSFW